MKKPKRMMVNLEGKLVEEPQRRFSGAKQRRFAIKDPITGKRDDVTTRSKRKYEVGERTGLGPDSAQILRKAQVDLSHLKIAKRSKAKKGKK